MQFLRLETVPYWLSGVSTNKVRPELRDKLLAYKRWVVRKVYEAFVLEFATPTPIPAERQDAALAVSDRGNVGTLSHVRELGLALVRLADEQMALERQQQLTNSQLTQLGLRVDKAASVVGQILSRVDRLEERTSAGGQKAITPEQASEISLAVKAIAGEMARRDQKEGNPYQRVFVALYQRYGIVTWPKPNITAFNRKVERGNGSRKSWSIVCKGLIMLLGGCYGASGRFRHGVDNALTLLSARQSPNRHVRKPIPLCSASKMYQFSLLLCG